MQVYPVQASVEPPACSGHLACWGAPPAAARRGRVKVPLDRPVQLESDPALLPEGYFAAAHRNRRKRAAQAAAAGDQPRPRNWESGKRRPVLRRMVRQPPPPPGPPPPSPPPGQPLPPQQPPPPPQQPPPPRTPPPQYATTTPRSGHCGWAGSPDPETRSWAGGLPSGPFGSAGRRRPDRPRSAPLGGRHQQHPIPMRAGAGQRSAAIRLEQDIAEALRGVDATWVEDAVTGGVRRSGCDQAQVLRIYRMAFDRVLDEDNGPFRDILARVKEVYEDCFIHRFSDELDQLRERLLDSDRRVYELQQEKRTFSARTGALQLEVQSLRRMLDYKEEQLIDVCQATGASVKGVAALRRTYSGQSRTVASIRKNRRERDSAARSEARADALSQGAAAPSTPSEESQGSPDEVVAAGSPRPRSPRAPKSPARSPRSPRGAGADQHAPAPQAPPADAPAGRCPPGFEGSPRALSAAAVEAEGASDGSSDSSGSRPPAVAVGRGYDYYATHDANGDPIDASCPLEAEVPPRKAF
eukprot:TRINITY_DN8794_c2_g2_i1.p1 TRINITY_DN8794_c2_g2~~TRINITY_DN8794_c2_g2_i1.p1  ORF type:complete len:526 (+),score=117.30 TRINITY_DN8794_c2_g2_i1:98-1675(+)